MCTQVPIAATLAIAVAVSSLGINAASAAPAASLLAIHQAAADNGRVLQIASKKKRHRGNNAAAAAAFMGIAGAMIGLAAQDSYRDRYDRRYGYGYAPRYRHDGYRGNRGYYYRNRGYAAPVDRNGLLPNNLPVGNDPLNADPYGR